MTPPSAHPRSSLHRVANVGREAEPMSAAERRRYFGEGWQEHGWIALQAGDVNDLLWSLLKREATRLYGERRL